MSSSQFWYIISVPISEEWSLQQKHFHRLVKNKYILVSIILGTGLITGLTLLLVQYQNLQNLQRQLSDHALENANLTQKLEICRVEFDSLASEDQKLRNDQLEEDLSALKSINTQAVQSYERILDLKDAAVNTTAVSEQWATVLAAVGQADLKLATESATELELTITTLEKEIAAKAEVVIPTAPASNDAPSNGYSRQTVSTEIGSFTVALVAGDLNSTKVILDTASAGNCGNDCPVLSLGDYVSRNGGYAGVNGTYFCPASYPSCADKKNSFDLLLMNKDKVYFNSDNNVYSNNPAVIFGSGYIRFVGAASQWGRDTSIDSMLSNYPLTINSGNINFTGDGDPKKGSKANRSFVANKGNTVYIGVVYGSTVAESAWALKALGMENALNLDSGGSTALWAGGKYVAGPGRNIPNAIIFVQK